MLLNLLLQKKNEIVKSWFEKTIATYPADTAKFIKKEKDPFSNPVGQTTSKGIEVLFDFLTDQVDLEKLSEYLVPVIRIRAIQDFRPGRAVEFIFFVKHAIRDALKNDFERLEILKELFVFENKVDTLSLHCFEIYNNCREKIYELKANEYRKQTAKIIEKFNMSEDLNIKEELKNEK